MSCVYIRIVYSSHYEKKLKLISNKKKKKN